MIVHRSRRSDPWSTVLLLAACSFATTGVVLVVEGLSSPSPKPNRPMVSLTGDGDVSGYLYGKLQRATSLYGSGLVGPATAIVHGDKDTSELLPPGLASETRKVQLKKLEGVLWNQFGMATCEGTVEREDLLTGMSYLKPRLAELRDTLVFLDATTQSTGGNNKNEQPGSSGGAGDLLGGLFSSFLSKKDPQQKTAAATRKPPPEKDFWLDTDLVQSAISRGSTVFVLCESKDTAACAKVLEDCLSSVSDAGNTNSIVTIVSPDDSVGLGGNDDAGWKSLRPQDLEGELSQAVSVRDGTPDVCASSKSSASSATGSSDNGSEARMAAAASPSSSESYKASAPVSSSSGKNLSLSRHDFAEVCVQCALRLPSTISSSPGVRVVRVAPLGGGEGASVEATERPNEDYFSRTGGKKAKAKAGTVASVDWTRTLACLLTKNHDGGGTSGRVKDFPKRPDLL